MVSKTANLNWSLYLAYPGGKYQGNTFKTRNPEMCAVLGCWVYCSYDDLGEEELDDWIEDVANLEVVPEVLNYNCKKISIPKALYK